MVSVDRKPWWYIRRVNGGLKRLRVENFGVLGRVDVRLERLSVLVGPNGSGKTTLLRVIQFLGDAARLQLDPALAEHGGFERLLTRPNLVSAAPPHPAHRPKLRVQVSAIVTLHAHEGALDEYDLLLTPGPVGSFQHKEAFRFKRTAGKGRRITLSGGKYHLRDDGAKERTLNLDKGAFGLALLPQLGDNEGATEVRKLQELFTTFRVFDIDVAAARVPAEATEGRRLRSNASNLAAFLCSLRDNHPLQFAQLVDDARQFVPGLLNIHFRQIGGATEAVAVEVEERALEGRTPLGAASFGTVRALALLAMLYDPAPPLLTCVEEIDHGLHPYVFDRLVDLMRDASKRTQFLIATHSPALVNRLRPNELIVCERDEATNLARIPAIDPADVAKMASAGELRLGELWFSGSLGGVPR